MILVFWMLNFKPAFSVLSFTLSKRLFSSCWLSAVREVSSAYMRLLPFLPPILILACDLSSPAFCMMYSAWKLNKQSANMQPCHTSFPILNQSVVPCPVLTVASWLAHRFIRRHIPTSLRIFHSLSWSTQSKALVVNETQVDVFLEFPCFLYDPTNVGNLIFGSFAFSKPSLYIWKFLGHILLKSSLKDFEHNLTSIWNEHNSTLVWTFFGIVLLWDWNENWHCPVLWPLLSFLNLLTHWVQHFNIIF